jgi:hypothetical protein
MYAVVIACSAGWLSDATIPKGKTNPMNAVQRSVLEAVLFLLLRGTKILPLARTRQSDSLSTEYTNE